MKRALIAVCLMSSLGFAADKAAGQAPDSVDGSRAERREELSRKARMMATVGIAEALELTDADALKLSEKLRAFEERRRPIRDGMADSVKALKSAAEGDAAAQAAVDQNVMRLLDGRAQMAALDKDLFAQLSAGQSPQKKAKLALFMAKFGEEMRHLKGKGRRFEHEHPR